MDLGIIGGHVARQDDAQNLGSDGALPYQRWVSYVTCGSYPPIGLVNQSSQEFMGVIL
jgi:hypothetical protein